MEVGRQSRLGGIGGQFKGRVFVKVEENLRCDLCYIGGKFIGRICLHQMKI